MYYKLKKIFSQTKGRYNMENKNLNNEKNLEKFVVEEMAG